jgi:hypothetical protein
MYYAACLFIAGLTVLFSCNKDDNAKTPVPEHLEGTAWKLKGILDVRTGILKELEPKNCEECYTMNFLSDSMAGGHSVANGIAFCFSQDCISKKEIAFAMTAVGDNHIGDVQLFYDALKSVDSYSYNLEKGELMLSCNNNKNYLLYKLIQQ